MDEDTTEGQSINPDCTFVAKHWIMLRTKEKAEFDVLLCVMVSDTGVYIHVLMFLIYILFSELCLDFFSINGSVLVVKC